MMKYIGTVILFGAMCMLASPVYAEKSDSEKLQNQLDNFEEQMDQHIIALEAAEQLDLPEEEDDDQDIETLEASL